MRKMEHMNAFCTPQTSPYVCGNLRKAWLQYADAPLSTSWSTWGSPVLGWIFKSWLQKEQKPPSTLDSCHFCVPNSTHPHQECGASHCCCQGLGEVGLHPGQVASLPQVHMGRASSRTLRSCWTQRLRNGYNLATWILQELNMESIATTRFRLA